ncbi:MAG: tetratricopeptide repeat protein [Anaeromyxobacter sp.]
MCRARSLALALATLALTPGPARGATGAPAVHVDPEAMAEARRGGPEAGQARAMAAYLEARACEREGDARGAATALQEAVTFDPASAELRAALARALGRLGRHDQAAAQAQAALERQPARAVAAQARVALARAAIARGDAEAATAELRLAAQLAAGAAAPGERVEPEPWRLLALIHLGAGEDAAALRTLEDLLARAPQATGEVREVGRRLLEAGELGRAEAFLRRATQAAPEDPEGWRLLAALHERTGREQEAAADLEKLLRAWPEDAGALRAMGGLALRAGQVEAARGWLGRYVEAAPSRPAAALEVVRLWLGAGRAGEALALARAASAAEGAPDPALQLAEGLALQGLGRHTEAARVLAAVPPGSPAWPAARQAQVDALSRAGRHGEATRAAAEGLRRQPGHVGLLLVQAEALERAGRGIEAAAGLGRAATALEASADVEGAVALQAARGRLLCRAGRPHQAVSALRSAAALHPDAPPLLLGLAEALEQVGELEAARAELRALLALQPEHAEAQARLRASLERQPRAAAPRVP